MLPDDVDARLRHEARRRGVSIADVAREAITGLLAGPSTPTALGFFAIGDGDPTDASERVDEFVSSAVGRHRPMSEAG